MLLIVIVLHAGVLGYALVNDEPPLSIALCALTLGVTIGWSSAVAWVDRELRRS